MQDMKLAFFILSVLLSGSAQAQIPSDQAFSKEWLHLLHMKRTWLGSYESSVRGEGFFLSPKGSKDPQAELQATIEKMFRADEATKSQVQCRFLARRDFLLRHGPAEWLSQKKICEFSNDWLSKLHATKMTLVFAAGYMNSAASSFGHTFLKLQNPGNAGGKELLDYGINFAARTEDTRGALYALYGLTGYFPGSFALLPYHQMIKEYTHLEGRDLWEYELNFTSEEVQRVLFHLLELDRAYFDYYFLDDNCSFELLKALEVGRPGLQLAGEDEFFVIPIDTVKRIRPLVHSVHFRPSLETEWRQRRDRLNSKQIHDLREMDRQPEENKLKDLDKATLSASQFLFNLKELENHERWKKINYEISKERAQRGPEEFFQIQSPEEAPDSGHDSSSVELGWLDQRDSYLLSGIRFAFHDQLSRNTGVSPFSHLEVLGFEWQSSKLEQNWLRRYRLIETLSTKSVNAFETPLSWGVSAGADQDIGHPTRLRHEISGRFGYSFDLFPERVRWSNFLAVGIQQDHENDFQFTPGVDSRIWILWTQKIRSLFQYEYWRFPSFHQQRLSGNQAFDLTDQLELRFRWESREENNRSQINKTIFLFQNFLM